MIHLVLHLDSEFDSAELQAGVVRPPVGERGAAKYRITASNKRRP